jgi:hypothetical protein
MEQEFLDAMSAYYYDGKATISDAEFDLLKEELLWAGSKVVVLDTDEQRFLEAVRSWGTGHPIMSDEDFDALRTELRQKGSIVAAQGPRCRCGVAAGGGYCIRQRWTGQRLPWRSSEEAEWNPCYAPR